MKKELRILLITQGYPYTEFEKGFLETELTRLKRISEVYILAICNHEIADHNSIESVYYYNDARPQIIDVIAQIRHFEVCKEIIGIIRKEKINGVIEKVRDVLVYSAHAENCSNIIEQIIGNKNINMVYTYWCLPATVASLRLKKKKDIKVISRFHGIDLYKERCNSSWQPLRNYISHYCSHLFFACIYGQQYYLDNYDCNIANTSVSYLGSIELDNSFLIRRDKLVIVSCSHVVALKRVDLIEKVVNQLANSIAVEWHHIGGPEDRIVTENINPHLRIVKWGEINHSELKETYKKIKPALFITLSETEGGVPVSIQEAFSAGIPAIGTCVGGIPEIITDHVNGFLVNDLKIQYICEIIMEYWKMDDENKVRMSNNARLTWERHFNAMDNSQKFISQVFSL